MTYRAVISSHMNPSLSGVAKFNLLLAWHLGVPCFGVGDLPERPSGLVLLSLKLSDSARTEQKEVASLLNRLAGAGVNFDLFLHTYDGLPVEKALVKAAGRVFCGNREIRKALDGAETELLEAWCPGLVDPAGTVRESALNLFSFGMAHKIQLEYYRKMKALLETHHVDYSLWVSTAFHEKARFGDFESIGSELHGIFGDRIQILGFLSDDAVNYFLDKAGLFISFFSKGVRANNTSVSAAMERGRAVLTNLDGHSPVWMRHGVNVLDIHGAGPDDFQKDRLLSLGEAARRDASRWASWDGLKDLIEASLPSAAEAGLSKER